MQAREEKLRLNKLDKPQSQDLANSIKAYGLFLATARVYYSSLWL